MHWIALQPLPEPSLAERAAGPGASGTSVARAGGGLPTREVALADTLVDTLVDTRVDALVDNLTALGWWALQFTPKVARVEDVLVLEVSASERLFGGRKQLLKRIFQSNRPVARVAYAREATSLIAIAKLQIAPTASPAASPASSASSAPRKPPNLRDRLGERLPDSLPLTTLAAARAHLPTLARIGCTTWGQLRALPRGGVVRRFGAELLDALDRAYGDQPELYPWLVLPEVFEATLELQAQVETAPALMFGARRLLAQLQVWLQMRQCGVLAFELGWTMDARRNTATQGALTVRTAEPTRDMAHLQRLLAENLARLTLPAPVLYLHLRTLQTEKQAAGMASLLLEDRRPGDSLHQLLERLSARLGANQVLQLQARVDHRPECMQIWQPISNDMHLIANYSIRTLGKSKKYSETGIKAHRHAHGHSHAHPQGLQADALYPTWLLAPPLKLAVCDNIPQCTEGGPLTLLAGPQRVEAGWWGAPAETQGKSRMPEPSASEPSASAQSPADRAPPPTSAPALRDYFLARSNQMGLLWVYRERLGGQGSGQSVQSRADAGIEQNADWYLHGLFA